MILDQIYHVLQTNLLFNEIQSFHNLFLPTNFTLVIAQILRRIILQVKHIKTFDITDQQTDEKGKSSFMYEADNKIWHSHVIKIGKMRKKNASTKVIKQKPTLAIFILFYIFCLCHLLLLGTSTELGTWNLGIKAIAFITIHLAVPITCYYDYDQMFALIF